MIIPVAAAMALTACASSSSSTTPGTTATTAIASTDQMATTAAERPVSGDVVEIDVKVGVDDRPDRVEQVGFGRQVIITLQSDEDEFYRLQGYGIEKRAAAGTQAEIDFTATMKGRFPLDSMTSGKVLLIVEVS